MAHEALGRGRHAADAGVAQQAGERRGAGEADPDRKVDALVTQPPDPVEDGGRREAELGDDVDRKPGCRRGLDLGDKRAVKLDCGKPRVAVRIARDADLGDAAAKSPPMTSTRLTPASSASRPRWRSSAVPLAKPRAAMCGIGSKPAAARRVAVSIWSASGRAGTALT
jgi:hypothetical protein